MILPIFLGLVALGLAENKKFRIKTYRVTVNVQDRYVRSEVAVQVKNNLNSTEKYEFGVKLDDTEFISSLTMRVGKKNQFYYGEVHGQKTAIEIFNTAVSQGQTAGLVSKEKDPLKDTTFSTFVAIPPGEEAFFWLTYEKQLSRSYSKYKYKTLIRPYEPVDVLQVKVNIVESRRILERKTSVQFQNSPATRSGQIQFTKNNAKSLSYSFESTDSTTEFQDTIEVSYDVDRPKLDGGDILVRDGYFVHFVSPENLPPIAKNIIFVIDESGSMSGQRIEQTKEAFQWIINDLNEEDFFQIITFDSFAQKLYPEFQAVSDESRKDGIEKVKAISAGGSTNIDEAMKLAVQQRNANDAANIIIFISDGEPTAGDSNWVNIRQNAANANADYYAIFSFAIGSSAPYEDLNKLSLMNNGLARQIFSDSEVLDQIKDFYHGVATPLVWNAKIKYENSKEVISSSGMVFSGSEMVILGKLEDPCAPPVAQCNDKLLVKAEHNSFCPSTENMEINCAPRPTPPPFDPNDPSRDKMENPKIPLESDINLEKYFAYLQMRGWLKIYANTDKESDREEMKTHITEKAIEGQFVTRFTSMVVVEESKIRKRRNVLHTKVRRSADFRQELNELFAQKAVNDLVKLERERRAVEIPMPLGVNSNPLPIIEFEQEVYGKNSEFQFATKLLISIILLSLFMKVRKPSTRGIRRFFKC